MGTAAMSCCSLGKRHAVFETTSDPCLLSTSLVLCEPIRAHRHACSRLLLFFASRFGPTRETHFVVHSSSDMVASDGRYPSPPRR
jgi:hypothetical protein